MTDKNTRGRASKVDLLPPNIKTQLAMMLRDKHLSQAQILEEINDLIRDCGLDDSYQLSRTGLNRYASRMEQMASKIRNAREVAEIWTKQFGEAPQSDIGKLLMEIVKNCQLVAAKAGCKAMNTYVKISYKAEGDVLTIDKKVTKHHQ